MSTSTITIEIKEQIADGVLASGEFITVICKIPEPTLDLDISDFQIPDGLTATNVRPNFLTWSDGSTFLQQIIFNLEVNDNIISKNNAILLSANSYFFKSGLTSYNVSSPEFDIESTHPKVTISVDADISKPLISTNGINLTFLFSEPASGFTQSDIWVTPGAGNISAFQMVSSNKYTAVFTPNDNTHMTNCVVWVNSSTYGDQFGNVGDGAQSAKFSIDTPDTTPPVPTLALSSVVSTADGIDINVSFSEVVSGFDSNDIQLIASDGYISLTSAPGDGKFFTFHYFPETNWAAGGGSAQIGIKGGGYTDLAGNAGLASEVKVFNVDVKPPAPAIMISDNELTSNENCRVVFTFDEPVKGFGLGNLSVSSDMGTLDHFQSDDSTGQIFSVIFSPRSGVEKSGVKILTDSGYTDIAGNPAQSSQSLALKIDTLAPEVSITLADAADSQLIAGESLKLMLAFTEAVRNFDLSDLSLSQPVGGLDNFKQEDAEGKVYSVIFTPQPGIEKSGVTMLLNGEYMDLAGNLGKGASSPALAIDTLAPDAIIGVEDTYLTRGESTLLTFNFTEAVSNFSAGDVRLDGAAVGLTQFTEVEAGKKFTALYTPPAETIDSSNIFSIATGSYTDLAGNLGGAAQSDNVSIDTVGKILFGTASSDVILGTAGADRISGLPQSGAGAGKDSSDLLKGLGGADVFVLGNHNAAFYDDGNNNSAGTKDFAAIGDFSIAEGDKIEVKAGTYFFSALSVGKLSGAGLYLDTNNSGVWDAKDELIGFLVGVNPSSVFAAHDLILV